MGGRSLGAGTDAKVSLEKSGGGMGCEAELSFDDKTELDDFLG